MTTATHILHTKRRAGILLHPTSLPGPLSQGQISHNAFRFIEFLANCGMSVWQTLPLGPTHVDRSPYNALSAHAADIKLISLDWLRDRGLLNKNDHCDDDTQFLSFLQQAYRTFIKHKPTELNNRFIEFCEQQKYWLDDFAIFSALRKSNQGKPWHEWDEALRDRHPKAIQTIKNQLADEITLHQFLQFLFFSQWQELKAYAAQHRILLFGDMPIYVAHDSADVWAHRTIFSLNENGMPTHVAGVPPDYFSETGQRWGNPQYDWPMLIETEFQWWQDRLKTQLQLFDIVRIDHFRGLSAYWDIAADETSAIHGRWVKAPGAALLRTFNRTFSRLPLVAEDLGHITPDVHALRKKFALPGMKILQFAFDGDPGNIYLPHNHDFNSVVYTGTHDNNTTLGWYQALPDSSRHYLQRYLGIETQLEANNDIGMLWRLIRTAMASVSCLAVFPMQDILSLGANHRMNTPGTTLGNWNWRFDWEQIHGDVPARLHDWSRLYQRLA